MKNLLTSKEWKEFLIDEIFRVKIGNNIDGNKVDKAKGCDAYITRKESNTVLMDSLMQRMNSKIQTSL